MRQKLEISWIWASVLVLSFVCLPIVTGAQTNKPNIVVIFGDDIGYWNVSAYNHGLMGWTPNIDSIAKNGILFTDHYGQPSCTAGAEWPEHIPRGRISNGIQNHEDLFVTLTAAAGLPNLKEDLLKGYKMGDTTYKVHLDGYNNLDLWTGKTEKSARREIFYYDETDLMAVRVDGWKMHIGVKLHNNWFDPKSYPSVPYIVNLLMDPMEKMTPDSEEYGYVGKLFLAQKLWAPTGAGPFLAAHLKSLNEFPPSQGADTLSMKKAIDEAMKKMESPGGSSN